MNVVDMLLAIIDQAYDHRSWHGTNLRGSIRGLSPTQAGWRPAKRRHNVWEIVVHAAYWKYAVWRRLTGANRGSFALDGSDWWVRPEIGGVAAWRSDIKLLERTHRSLRHAVTQLPPRELRRPLKGSRVTPFDVVAGIAAHDLYHAGQIQLLKKRRGRRS